ncbi:hypothetical protein Clacol_006406 [Clathrus columnatus]|uniref:Uncharacterized protein n=1 Tax=Clathrus columnatus TaxID=1419009 RepID=A0AAV5ACS4_9AGAM|nr:hypothetical protein Clacol_006406 [Clathrus columnatus]
MASQSDTEPETVQYASQLADISAREDIPEQERWNQVAIAARRLADRLRNRHGEVDEHSALGRTPLPRTLTALVNEALAAATIPNEVTLTAVYELLRTSANFCMDHNANRKLLLDASYPQTVIVLLRRYSTLEMEGETPIVGSRLELQVLKTSAGVLLNMSLHYEPIRRYLISVDTPDLLIRLRSYIFPPCLWSAAQSSPKKEISDIKEEWTWRSGFASWSSLALTELLRDQQCKLLLTHSFHSSLLSFIDTPRIIKPTSLRPLVSILRRFIPPYKPTGPLVNDATMRNTLCTIEEELLADACSLLESSAIDSEDIQLFIGQTITETNVENNPGPLLKCLIDFVELAEHPLYWSLETPSELEKHIKAFEMCKAAIIKAIVEVAGCPSSMDTLWDLMRPSGWFVSTMIRWIKLNPQDEKNDLLLICATLSLANLARRESHCTTLVQAPISIVSDIIPLLDGQTDIKVRHGALGLLKHLAQTTATQAALSEAMIIEKLLEMEIWSEKLDMAEPVQLLAIGTVKHLCTNNVENATKLAIAKADPSSATGVQQILALVKRSDTVAVKSEGTRAIFQVIRSVCSQTSKVGLQSDKRELAIQAVTDETAIKALAELAGQGRHKPYFILILEGVLGMTLLSLQPGGASLVAKGLLAPLPTSPPVGNLSRSTSQSGLTSPITDPNNLFELLVEILINENYAGELIPIELRVNTCSLLGSVGRKDTTDKDGEYIRLKCHDRLKSLADGASDHRLKDAARKALDVLVTEKKITTGLKA